MKLFGKRSIRFRRLAANSTRRQLCLKHDGVVSILKIFENSRFLSILELVSAAFRQLMPPVVLKHLCASLLAVSVVRTRLSVCLPSIPFHAQWCFMGYYHLCIAMGLTHAASSVSPSAHLSCFKCCFPLPLPLISCCMLLSLPVISFLSVSAVRCCFCRCLLPSAPWGRDRLLDATRRGGPPSLRLSPRRMLRHFCELQLLSA